MTPFTRRALLARSATAAAVTAAAPMAGAAKTIAATPRKRVNLDLDKPLDNVTAYMKMRATTETGEAYFWYAGTLDLCAVDEPMRALVGYQTLMRRTVERRGPAEWLMSDREATVYCDPASGAPIGTLKNPLTGETVDVLNFLEGPVNFLYTEMEPRIIGSRDVLKKEGKPFHYPWRIEGNDLWMSKSGYITTHTFLDPAKYPKASAGPNLYVSHTSVLNSKLDDVADPDVANADAYYSYTATSSWLPWLRMGQRPGFVVWRSNGRKIPSLDAAPPEMLANIQRVHPALFEAAPWKDYRSVFHMYRDRYPEGP